MNPNLLVMVAAALAFITVAGLGLVFAGGDGGQAKTIKRAQAIGGGTARPADRASRAKAAANEPGARRKQILKTLKDQERQNRKASLTLVSRLMQAGLAITPKTFWIISVSVGDRKSVV